jgi:uncharacterized protein
MSSKQGQQEHIVCVYHAGCDDGFGAACAVHKYYSDNIRGVTYFPMHYGKGVPGLMSYLADANPQVDALYIVDFSFPNDILEQLCKLVKHVHLFDHHKTFAEQRPWPSLSNLRIVFDNDRSGAMITWNEFFDQQVPMLINHIQDNDLWHHDLPSTKEIIMALRSYPQDMDLWLSKFCSPYPEAINSLAREGEVISRYYNQQMQEILNTCARRITLDGHEGLVCNAPRMFASDLGHRLANMSGTYGATYIQLGDGTTVFSLRSIGDYDVSAIAKLYGGGGHKNAAGFAIDGDSAMVL